MSAARAPRGDQTGKAPTDTKTGDQLPLAVAVVARRLGVAPATLRTWDRRYGLGPTAHSAGSHRRYTTDDVARLVVMRRLTSGGVAPGDAARSALAAGPARPTDVGHEAARLAALVEAALRPDEGACRQLLAVAPDVLTWWCELVEPARAALGAITVLAHAGEDPAGVLESAALAALRSRVTSTGDPDAPDRPVLVFAVPPERPSLLAHALALGLFDRGLDARVVTGAVDPGHLLELVAQARPVAVALLSERTAPDLAVVAALVAAEPGIPVVLEMAGGQRARGLAGLVDEVLAVTG
ncbi:MerR family transcriptional regulator [Pengzhenrongella phosphoraccumulans]|uniref:MerR family transcriptional regulator n=1 Tax=Pengzhenrongella phosphoraccumulans TaxID=3114394 RepID=UPI0038902F1F